MTPCPIRLEMPSLKSPYVQRAFALRRIRRCVPLSAALPLPALAADGGASPPLLVLGVLLLLGLVAVLLFRQRQLCRVLRAREEDLARSAHEWSQAMDFLEDPMYLVDLDDRLVRANKAFFRQVGKTPAEALGRDVRTLIHLKPEETPCPACAARLERRDAFFTKEGNDPTNPTGRPIEVTIRVVRDHHGEPVGMLQGLRDLSHLRATEEALFREKERAEVTLKAIGDAVLTTDASGRINYLNPAAERLLGQGLSAVGGHFYDEVLNIIDEVGRQPVADPIVRCLGRRSTVRVAEQTLLIDPAGNEYAVDVVAAPILDREGASIGAVLAMHDVSAIRGVTRQLNYQATHDALTGLINRREFEVRLRQVMESAQVDGSSHSLMFMDLDRFKVINDSCGHAAGDVLLKEVAELFASHFRTGDTLARLGGDEFAVLLEGCPVGNAEHIGRELVDKLKVYRLCWDGQQFEVGVSIGLVAVDAECVGMAEVVAAADTACYRAKASGRNRVCRYYSDDVELARHQGQAQWVPRITRALEQGRFALYCQAIQSLADLTADCRHYEILLRMQAEDGTLIMPGEFLPAAERFDLMPAIDRWVVERMFALLAGDDLRVPADTVWSINLSGQSLGDTEFLDFVLQALDDSDIVPGHLCFEITETAAVSSFATARRFIAAMRERGIHFSLDDFGSGLSSFAYLKNLDVDFLKIDGGFVRDMVDDTLNYALVRSIHEVGCTLGVRTIAEFVENDAIIDRLHHLQVDFAQGYGIARPQPLSNLMGRQAREQVG